MMTNRTLATAMTRRAGALATRIAPIPAAAGFAWGAVAAPATAWAMFGGAVAGMAALFAHPALLFSLYFVVSLGIRTVEISGFPLSLNQVLGAAFLVAALRRAAQQGASHLRSGALAALAALAAFHIASAWTGYSRDLGRSAAQTIATLAAVSIGVAAVMNNGRGVRLALWAIVAASAASAAVAACEFLLRRNLFVGDDQYFMQFYRVDGLAPNSIVFAYGSLFAFPAALWLARHAAEPRGRAAGLMAALLLLGAPLLTFNRQTLAMAPALALAAAILFGGRLGRFLAAAWIAGALALGPALAPAVMQRFSTLGALQFDASFRTRQDNVINSLQIWKARPWFGCGVGSFPAAWWPYRSHDTHFVQYKGPQHWETDMNYARMLAEQGAAGVAVNLMFWACMIGMLWRRRRCARWNGRAPAADFAAAILLMWLLFLLAGAIQDTAMYLSAWLMYALAIPIGARGWEDRFAEGR